MTLIPTHLSLTGIFFWTALSSNEREIFKHKKKAFWIILLFSILPDIDILFGLHRGFSHSFILPLFLINLGTIIHYYYKYLLKTPADRIEKKDNKDNSEIYSFWGRCLSYSGILWIIHIVLDLEYPLAVVYPLSDRLYQVNFTYIIDLIPWLIFPAMIIGMGFEVTSVSFLRGISAYFINLSPESRQQIFGGRTATFFIEDFFMHAILFGIFLAYVVRPMAPSIRLNSLTKLRKNISFDGPVLSLGIVLLIFGLFLGPMIGPIDSDAREVNGAFQVSQTVFSPFLALTFESTQYLLQPNTILIVKGNLTTSPDSDLFDHKLLITTKKIYEDFSTGVSNLFLLFPFNSSINADNFKSGYSVLLEILDNNSFAINSTSINEIVLETKLFSGSYSLIGLIENWDFNEVINGTQLLENASLKVSVSTNRLIDFTIGYFTILVGLILVCLSVLIKRLTK